MRRNSTHSNRRFAWGNRSYAWISLIGLLLLAIASGIFAYQVSPLRDPSFQPLSVNCATLIPELQWIQEREWVWGATGLAGLLATNLVLLLWQWSQTRETLIAQWRQRWIHPIGQAMVVVVYLGVGFVLFIGLGLLFVGFLMGQCLID